MRIQVPNPCTENWQQMSPEGRGRHCEKCSKTVVDFTTMSDKGIVDYMKAHPGSCGKFSNWQLDRDLTKNILPEKSSHWMNTIAAMSLLSAQMAGSDIKAQSTLENLESKLADTNSTNIQCFSLSNIFKFRITNTEDSAHRIKEIKIELDTFSLSFDSLENQFFSFHIPSGLNYEDAKITLIENDTVSTILFVPKSSFLAVNSLSYNVPTIHFYKDSSSWKYISEIPFIINPYPYYEVMGVPPMINYFDTSLFKNIYMVTNVFQTVGFSVPVDTTEDSVKTLIDTPTINIKKEEKEKPIKPRNKLNLFWKFLFFIGLGTIIYWMSHKIKKGK